MGGSGNMTSPAAVTVTTAATLLAAGRGGREGILVQNLGATDIYVGGPQVTAATGIRVAASGGTYTDEFYHGALYAVTAAGSSTDVRVQEVH